MAGEFAQLRAWLAKGVEEDFCERNRIGGAFFSSWSDDDSEKEVGKAYLFEHTGFSLSSIEKSLELISIFESELDRYHGSSRERVFALFDAWDEEIGQRDEAWSYVVQKWKMTEESFKEGFLKPPPELFQVLPYHRTFARGEFKRLQLGLRAYQMEERWVAVFASWKLRLYRSWTGLCVYELDMEPWGEGCMIKEARVARDGAWASRNSEAGALQRATEEEVRLLDWLISSLILGQDVEFPS